MDIWDDRRIGEIIDFLKGKLRKRAVSSQKDISLSAPRFVFICGKDINSEEETIRNITIQNLERYMNKNDYNGKKNSVLCVISENLYIQDLSEDVFSFEKMLAEISQRIIIVTESAGTFCELGAFVMDEECCKKTIVINEDNPDYKTSFVTRGPIKMLENISEEKVILHNGIDRIRTSEEYKFRMKQIAKEDIKIQLNNNFKDLNLKSLIYELTNIVELFQPIENFEIQMLYKRIKRFNGAYEINNKAGHKINSIKKVIILMEKMQILVQKSGYYMLNSSISCYNVLFNITRKEYNDLRIKYINRVDKYQPERLTIKSQAQNENF